MSDLHPAAAQSVRLYMEDKAKAKSDEWKKGPRISWEDVKEGKGAIEHITAEEALRSKGSGSKSAAGSVGAKVMSFGKHKSKEWDWVKKNDPSWWSWAISNVPWFAKQVEKAGG